MKKIACLAVFFGLCVLVVAVGAAEMRTWTAGGGKFTTEAELVEVSKDGLFVTLRKKIDGKEIQVAMERLSEEDKEYVAKQKKEVMKQPEKAVTPNAKTPINTSQPAGQVPRAAISNQPPQRDNSLFYKKIDAVNRNNDGTARVELSEEEKGYIVQYLLLAEKALRKKESEDGLSLLMWKLKECKDGDFDFFLARQFGREVTKAEIKYDKIDAYVTCLAGWSVAWNLSGGLAASSINAREESRKYATRELADRSAGASAAASSARGTVSIIESLLPECNRLSGNAHDKEEKERLDKKQREAEKKQLFGK